METKRTYNTLFMISSVDGKISTGSIDKRDIDKDFPKVKGVAEGLNQYYKFEQQTDINSFNTGKVMSKIGINKKQKNVTKLLVSFIIVDNSHLTSIGIDNLLKKSKILYLVTKNKNHPAFKKKAENLKIIFFAKKINFSKLFEKLKQEYEINRVTIQSGGTMNSTLLREGLIDELSLVVAPVLIGGEKTSTLIDGKSLTTENDLRKIKALKLKNCVKLKNSYLHLTYQIIN